MSHGVILNAAGSDPAIATQYTTDAGAAVPVANNLNIEGTSVAAGTTPVETTGVGDTVTIEVQRSQAVAATDATRVGLSAYNSADFTVDGNGFVSLVGGGTGVTLTGQSGGALAPVAGNFNVFGASTASGTSPVTTSGAGNTLTVNVQKSQALAATDATKVGLANFDSAAFSVDADGFVTLKGGGIAIDSISPNSGTDPIVPDANGKVSIIGTGSITTVGSLNTETIQLTGLTNHAVLVGAGTATITNVGPTATAGQVLQSSGVAADPVFSTATYPTTTTINQLLYSSAANTVSGLATANKAVITTTSAGIPVATALATDGQLIIGSTAGAPAAASITSSDSSVTITPGSNSISLTVAGGTTVGKTITGQSGGALAPTAGNWNISGSSPVAGTSPVVTSGSGSTLTVNVQKAQALAATDATKVGLSNFDSAAFAVDANGFVSLKGGGQAIDSISPNSGTDPIVPDANGKVSILGTGSITAVGSLNTETIQLTGLTNHALLVGAGTATITKVGPSSTSGQVLQSAGASADPVFSTATYPATTTINQILYSSAASTVTGLASANRGVLTTGSTGVPVITAINGNGLLIIGSASSQPAAANLTAGTGIGVVNGSNTITINSTGGGLTWGDTSGVATVVSNRGYFVTAAATPTLPSAPANGDTIAFVVLTAALCTITGNTGQKINLAGSLSAAAGTCATSTAGFAIKLTYRSTATTWWATDAVGSWTIT
jgi:trimeric autotransporter adhesin